MVTDSRKLQAKDYEVVKIATSHYLSYVRGIPAAQRRLDEEIRMLESSLLPKGIRYTGMSGGTPEDVADKLQRLEDKKMEWVDMLEAYLGDYLEAWEMCGPSFPNRHILWLREVEHPNMSWGALASFVNRKYPALCYSERKLREMARTGRFELYEMMPEEHRRSAFPNAQPL